MTTRALLAAAAALAALTALPASAAAAPCGGAFQFDSGGYEWDFAVLSATSPLGSFADGGSGGPAGAPAGPRSAVDSYDDWGGLFVGGQSVAGAYTAPPADANGCFNEEAGREQVFPTVAIDGLEVHRKVYVSTGGLPGARILNVVHNPTGVARTTSVQVGDTLSSGIFAGDLGSDDDTLVRFSSSGDATMTPGDRWAVTSDHGPAANDTNSDLALAHVFDGRGGDDRIDFVTQTTTDVPDQDDLAYRWEGVTIPAGGTVAFLSYEIQQGVAGANGAAEDDAARRAALAYDANPLAQVYAGMTDAEIVAVRNWPPPAPTAAFTVVAGASDRTPATFSAGDSTASSVPGSCSGISYAWDFGDGATATGAATSHPFAAGSHVVKLTVRNSCGASATTTQTVDVADTTAPTATLAAPRSTRLARLRVQLQASESGTAALSATIPPAIAKRAGTARIARTIAKAQVSLQAGQTQTVRLRVKRRVARALKRVRRVRLTLAVTVTDAAGNASTLRKRIKART